MSDHEFADRVAWVQPPYGDPAVTPPAEVAWATRVLEGLHLSADLGNRSDPVEELVWIPLTRQTHRQNAVRSWQRIVDLGGPPALLEITEHELAALLKDSGFSRQKASWIRRSLEMVLDRFGRLSLDDTATWSDDEVQAFLESLPGIAVKSAKCVMMYSLGREVLPVDTHLRRLAERIGWVPAGLTERRIHLELERSVAPELRYPLHVNAIWHGRSVCRALRPRCGSCAVQRGCERGVNEAYSSHRDRDEPSDLDVLG